MLPRSTQMLVSTVNTVACGFRHSALQNSTQLANVGMSYCGFRIPHIAENSQCWKTVILLVNFRWWALCRHLNSPSSWQWWSLNMPRKATSNLSTFYCTIGWADFWLSIVRKLVIIYCVKIKQSFNYPVSDPDTHPLNFHPEPTKDSFKQHCSGNQLTSVIKCYNLSYAEQIWQNLAKFEKP